MPFLSLTLAALGMIARLVTATTYDMIKEYHGTNFFDDWTFYDNYDNLTNGDAIFVGANSDLNLAYVDSSTNRAIMKVDNSSAVAYNYKRSTVRITSDVKYDVGSLWVADMYHVPYGCSVWPAWWSQGDNWPAGGEIDTFEGVNQVTRNQMTLHTEDGCEQVDPVQTSTIINSTDCNYEVNDNQGCAVTDSTDQSYGAAFAAAQGGVFVTEFAESGISIWFFSRNSVPDSISANSSSINIDDLGTPSANWPNGGCDIDNYFEAQSLIFDVTLCGDYAGSSTVFAQTCSGTCYTDYVIGDASYYDNAYFDVDFVRVFSTAGTNTTVTGEDSSAGSPTPSWSVPFLAACVVIWVAI